MTIDELINELISHKNKVVPKNFILSRLREIERHDRDLDEQIDLNQPNRFAGLLQTAKKEVV